MKAMLIRAGIGPMSRRPVLDLPDPDPLAAARALMPQVGTFVPILVEWGTPPRRVHMLADRDGGPRMLPHNAEASALANIPIVGDVLLLDGLLS